MKQAGLTRTWVQPYLWLFLNLSPVEVGITRYGERLDVGGGLVLGEGFAVEGTLVEFTIDLKSSHAVDNLTLLEFEDLREDSWPYGTA